MNSLSALVDALCSGAKNPNGKAPLRDLGVISCGNTVHIRHVPFFEPCIIVVLSGRKVIYGAGGAVECTTHCAIAVPGPASFDIRNEPDPHNGRYRALIIPFKHTHIERMRNAHVIEISGRHERADALSFDHDPTLIQAVEHYLRTSGSPHVRDHRLMEILLILAGKDARLLAYAFLHAGWSQRVRAILGTDLAHEWALRDICMRLATSESSLRRNLGRENTHFRELLYELRLNAALTQLLQTSLPVYRIATDCGYRSVSRFTSNFHKRFGVPPTVFRASMNAGEQNLADGGQRASG